MADKVEISNQLRLKAATAARELAAKTKSGMNFGLGALFQNGQPCCVLGHLLNKIGIHSQWVEIIDLDKPEPALPKSYIRAPNSAYAALERLSGITSGTVFVKNDALFNTDPPSDPDKARAKLAESLQTWADAAENLARQDHPTVIS